MMKEKDEQVSLPATTFLLQDQYWLYETVFLVVKFRRLIEMNGRERFQITTTKIDRDCGANIIRK